MPTLPTQLHQRLRDHGQEHVVAAWDRLDDTGRTELLRQLQGLDLPRLRQLYDNREHAFPLPDLSRVQPVPVARLREDDVATRSRGENALRRGQVAVLLVAGGQGSRLGFEHPKGMYPVGPVSNHSLFQILAEKVLALRRRYGRGIPFLIMTSPATDAETAAFFRQHHFFGLPQDEVFFFEQGTMPALDLATGRLLLEAPGRLFLSPNGHGGTLTALAESGLLAKLRAQGVTQLFYSQIDNPLVKIADPLFLGHHLGHDAQVSAKVLPKNGPFDKLGNFAQLDGRCIIIEYSDLPEDLARQTDEQGNLRFGAGSPAIHWFSLEFLDWVSRDPSRMPFHVARKKVPYLDESGRVVQPSKENALKFERFIFDALPLAERWTVVETSRAEEFAPLKNATGADSPETVRQALGNLAADWLTRAGVQVPRKDNGDAAVALEISPLVALDAAELRGRLKGVTAVTEPRYFGDD